MEADVGTASWTARGILLGTVPVMAAFGVRFHRRQNGGALGGAISGAKAYWLSFAIWFWFVVCPTVAFDGVVAPPLALALGAYGVFMWIRGAAEMFMLYVTKNWRPPIGIGHDVLCILLVAGLLAMNATALMALSRPIDLWALGLCLTVLVSLVVEIHHAYSFFHAVKGMTTGDDGVWFADDHNAVFRKINRNTFRWNVILSVVVGAFVLRYVAGGAP
jgi:hypothetical protein